MIFLSSPYTAPDKLLEKTRFLLAESFVLHALREWELPIFSPIVYWHPLATTNSLPTDAEFWFKFNADIIRHCERMFVLQIKGWEESRGVRMELNLARILGLPLTKFGANFEEIREE